MSHHVVQGLKWARLFEGWPSGIPRGSRARGAKAAGRRYERSAAKATRSWASHGQWWEFADASGLHKCQTDLFMAARGTALVLECKYTFTSTGFEQIAELYAPVVRQALGGVRVLGVQVCKVLTPEIHEMRAKVCSTLQEAIDVAANGSRPAVLHWLGLGPLGGHPYLPQFNADASPINNLPQLVSVAQMEAM